jgi:hypothetical protein
MHGYRDQLVLAIGHITAQIREFTSKVSNRFHWIASHGRHKYEMFTQSVLNSDSLASDTRVRFRVAYAVHIFKFVRSLRSNGGVRPGPYSSAMAPLEKTYSGY